jgi:hypothetical protein
VARRAWDCPGCGRAYYEPDLVCEACGTVAGQLRWQLSIVEKMCNYSTHFGRNPLNRGGEEARRREALSVACPDCDGTSCVRPVLLETWRSCPRCHGTGYVRKSELNARGTHDR